jgi:hypothetical protein
MFPLPAGPWPVTIEQLQEQLAAGLRTVPIGSAVDSRRLAVTGQWPALTELTLELSGVRIDPATAWVAPKSSVERRSGPSCRHFRIVAVPLRIGDYAQPELDFQASEVQFDFMRDEEGRHWLIPAKVGGGSIHARITGADLDRLFLETARGLSRAQGVTVDEARVRLTPAGSNTIRIESEIGARKMFVKGRVRISGSVGISPAFEVTLRELECEGIGPIGAIAAKAVQPRFDRLRGRPLQPFGSWVSGLTLEQCELHHRAGDVLQFDARLAAATSR